MKTIISIIILSFTITFNGQAKIEINDFKNLNNTSWKGTLMYLDYSDGKEKRLPTTMLIKIKNNKIISEIKFPGEPKANSKNTTKIKKKGTYFGNEKVIEKSILEDETLKVVTFFEGKDNNKKAKMYKTYLYSKEKITIVKEVMYFNSDEKFIRNKQEFIKTQKL